MLQKFTSAAFVFGALLTILIPAVALAEDHGRNSGGWRGGSSGRSERGNSTRNFSGGNRSYAPRGSYGGSRYPGGQSFASPRGYDGRRDYSRDHDYSGHAWIAPSYRRPVPPGYYNRGYLGYGAPYGYSYDPGYLYDPGYSYGPAPVPQACGGSYDRYGTWYPDPNCYSDQQPYPPQQGYYPNQPQP